MGCVVPVSMPYHRPQVVINWEASLAAKHRALELLAVMVAGEWPVADQRPSVPYYPDCSTCGHNASGVVAFHCTVFVSYPEGDPHGLAGYCPCRCGEDPVIKAWLAREVTRG